MNQTGHSAGVLDQGYEVVPVDALSPHPDNPRRGDTAAIGESIVANGFYGAVIAQRSTGYVLAGNHRLLAARAAGIRTIPTVWVDVDDERAKRILLTDNRTSDIATNDEAALLSLLEGLALTPELLAGTGYDMDALEDLRVVFDSVPAAAPADTDAHYAETPEEEAARQAGRGLEPSTRAAGLRELILVFPTAEQAAILDVIAALKPALGPDATSAQVVAAALRMAIDNVSELATYAA